MIPHTPLPPVPCVSLSRSSEPTPRSSPPRHKGSICHASLSPPRPSLTAHPKSPPFCPLCPLLHRRPLRFSLYRLLSPSPSVSPSLCSLYSLSSFSSPSSSYSSLPLLISTLPPLFHSLKIMHHLAKCSTFINGPLVLSSLGSLP